METTQNDVLTRLESAIEGWNSQIAGAHLGLSEQITGLHDRVQNLRGGRVAEEERAAWAQVQAEAESLAHRLSQRDEDLGRANALIAELREEAARMRGMAEEVQADRERILQSVGRIKVELESAQAENARLRERCEELEITAQQGMVLEQMLQQEQSRAERLEKQLRDKRHEETINALNGQLTAAIHDRDEAHQEIVTLRTELNMLRRANAALSLPKSDDARQEMAPIEIFDTEGRRLRVGEILIKLGLITQDQVSAALREQAAAPYRRIGAILVENGHTSEDAVSQVLARQLDLPFVRLAPGVVDDAAPCLIPGQLARRRLCLPLTVSADRIVVAMANPFDLVAMDEIEMATGRRVDPVVATPSEIAAALLRHYGNA